MALAECGASPEALRVAMLLPAVSRLADLCGGH